MTLHLTIIAALGGMMIGWSIAIGTFGSAPLSFVGGILVGSAISMVARQMRRYRNSPELLLLWLDRVIDRACLILVPVLYLAANTLGYAVHELLF